MDFYKEIIMMNKNTLTELLNALRVEDELLLVAGDWEALDQVRLAIDAVEEQINRLEKE
jgi:hypothetical protein